MADNQKVLRGLNLPGLEGTYYIDAVSYNEQTLTDEQKAQVQKNIGVDNKLDAYIITGTWDCLDDVYSATLDDNFDWDDMVAAINANKYVGCVLRPESPPDIQICLTLGGVWNMFGYVVFNVIDEAGWVYELVIKLDGSVYLSYYQLTTAEYVNNVTVAQIITWEEDD